jgi:hypothetical protein
MKVLDRAYQPISLTPVLEGRKLEIRIHGDASRGDQPAHLTSSEARILAFSLLVEAEKLTAHQAGPGRCVANPAPGAALQARVGLERARSLRPRRKPHPLRRQANSIVGCVPELDGYYNEGLEGQQPGTAWAWTKRAGPDVTVDRYARAP